MKPNFIIDNIDSRDWLFGKGNVTGVKIPRLGAFLPSWESQKFRNFDPWWCVTGSLLNVVETIFNYKIANNLISAENIKWLYDNWYIDENGKVNFDDWFLARVSNTLPGRGNTLKNVADSARHYGLTPQMQSPFKMGDYDNDLDDYNQSVPDGLYELGRQFLSRFILNYEVVFDQNFHTALDYSPLQVAVSNWLKQEEYYVTNGGIVHATMLYDDSPWLVFDTYSPFIKQLADDYRFMDYGYAWYVTETKTSLIIKLMDYFFRLTSGAIYWVKGGTNKAQKVTPYNAGLAAITHLMRKEQSKTILDQDLDKYVITNEFFPEPKTGIFSFLSK